MMGAACRAPIARFVLLLALMPSPLAAAQPVVDAADYDSFWVWGGITPSPVLATARTVYVLQGEVHLNRRRGEVGVIAQGPAAMPRITTGEAWLVYRANTLNWPESVYGVLLAQVARWRAAGNPVAGLQIDFDSSTKGLSSYAGFLRDLGRRLPSDCRLSITGLMDWGSNAAAADLDQLAGVVDEVVVQTYQGKRTIPTYMAYMPRIARLSVPFKIGLVEGGEWLEPAGLTTNPQFRGYVVFLQGSGTVCTGSASSSCTSSVRSNQSHVMPLRQAKE